MISINEVGVFFVVVMEFIVFEKVIEFNYEKFK